MASTAWTATRAELVQELAKARAEAARASAAATQLQAEADERRRRDVERQRKCRRNAKARSRRREQIVADLMTEAVKQEIAFQEAVRRTPPDPNAAQHRRTLIAALKEKP